MKTLGEALRRTTEKDSNIAAELYNPGFDSESDERDPNVSLEPGRHDISSKARQDLGKWASEALSDKTYAYTTDKRFVDQANEDAKSRFGLTSKNNATLGQLIVPSPYGIANNSLGLVNATEPGRIASQGMLSGWNPAVASSNRKSTAYPEPPTSNAPLDLAIQNSLEKGNLHAPGRAYLSEPGSEMEDGTIRDGLYSIQNGSFGKFDPERKRMEVDDLKRAVEATLENARGIVSDDGSDDKGILASLLDFTAPTIAPLQGIYDVRISKIQAIKDKFGEVEGQDEIARIREDFSFEDLFTKGGGTTYGVLNTPSQVFDGPPNGMIMTAYAGFILLKGLVRAWGLLMHLLISDSAQEPSGISLLLPASMRRASNELGLKYYDLGVENRDQYTSSAKSKNNTQLLNFDIKRASLSSIIDMADKGLDIFYGYDPSQKISLFGVEIASPFAYKSIFDSTGYYASITRNVLRDAQILTQFTKQASGTSSGTGVADAMNSLSSLVEALLTSPSFKLVVQFFKLGTLNQLIESNIKENPGLGKNKEVNNNLYNIGNDNNPLFKASADVFRYDTVDRSRFSKFSFGPGIKISTLSPRSFVSMVLVRTSQESSNAIRYTDSSDSSDVPKKRYTEDQVTAIEEIIDAEYLPFSFHDLRTNEIISLPAFLDSVNDSFNVSYESTHGYGRTDPVHSYAKTERNINFTFHLVSMEESDHSYIYDTVNRLVAMCYPQRSQGVRRTDGNWEFTQPFSQIPTASPVIRIRVGDLLGSNLWTHKNPKSIFGRIFGAVVEPGNPRSQQNVEKIRQQNEEVKAKYDRVNGEDLEKMEKETLVIIKKGTIYRYYNEDGFNKILRDIDLGTKQQNQVDEFTSYSTRNDMLAVYKKLDTTEVSGITFEGRASHIFEILDIDYRSDKLPDQRPSGVKRIYKIFVKGQEDKFSFERNLLPVPEIASPDEFLDPDSNAVVRSFNSTKGRGLAGVIKDLQLDYSGFNWGIDNGRRAPMGVKVSITFAPIHDMPLGLDHNGRMMGISHPASHLR